MSINFHRSSDEITDPLLTKEDYSSKQKFSQGKLLTFCFLLALIAIIFFVFSLPITQIVIGSLYINQCPVNNLIPIHLIVTGVSTLILFIICIVQVSEFCFIEDD